MPRTPKRLTPTDLRALSFVEAFWKAHGRSPSLREVASGCGWSVHTTAQRHIDALVGAGKLQRDRASGQLVLPGQKPAQPWLAPLVGSGQDPASSRQWVFAPGPHLMAWRVEDDDNLSGNLVFADTRAKPRKGQECLVYREGRGCYLAEFQGELQSRKRPQRDLVVVPGLAPPKVPVELVGPVRFVLLEAKGDWRGDKLTWR